MKRRDYDNYDAYLAHQREKTVKPSLHARLVERRDARLAHFRREMEDLAWQVPPCRALCLGARLGEEVEVLRSLGFDAVGIDLVAHPPLVVEGDFHHAPFPDAEFGLLYCNCVDHVFDLDAFAAECRRLLVPGGHFLAVLRVDDFGSYESLRLDDEAEFTSRLPGFSVLKRTASGTAGKGLHVRLLLKKEAAA